MHLDLPKKLISTTVTTTATTTIVKAKWPDFFLLESFFPEIRLQLLRSEAQNFSHNINHLGNFVYYFATAETESLEKSMIFLIFLKATCRVSSSVRWILCWKYSGHFYIVNLKSSNVETTTLKLNENITEDQNEITTTIITTSTSPPGHTLSRRVRWLTSNYKNWGLFICYRGEGEVCFWPPPFFDRSIS